MSEEEKTIEIEDALKSVLDRMKEIIDSENVPLALSYGRVLAEKITAPFPVPSFPKSAMDGYAVKSSDVASASVDAPVSLEVVGERLAGAVLESDVVLDDNSMVSGTGGMVFKTNDLAPEDNGVVTEGMVSETLSYGRQGSAVRIMTGAAIPVGYDAVVRQEDTDYGEDKVMIYKGVQPYANYCKVGEDIKKGESVLEPGSRIGRVEAGVIASLGFAEVKVRRKLRVGIISTGSELREVGTPLTEGSIYNSISYTIMGALASPCFEVESRICSDDADEIKAALENALHSSDVVITTGGVSVGKKDLLPEVLDEIGATKLFKGVNIQPGTPTIGSIKDGKFILSLSGNPFAALVNFDLYFWPVAAKLLGSKAFLPIVKKGILSSEYGKVSYRRRMLRAKLEEDRVYLPEKCHASSVLSNLLNCNCYIDVPADTRLKVGDIVTVRMMPSL